MKYAQTLVEQNSKEYYYLTSDAITLIIDQKLPEFTEEGKKLYEEAKHQTFDGIINNAWIYGESTTIWKADPNNPHHDPSEARIILCPNLNKRIVGSCNGRQIVTNIAQFIYKDGSEGWAKTISGKVYGIRFVV